MNVITCFFFTLLPCQDSPPSALLHTLPLRSGTWSSVYVGLGGNICVHMLDMDCEPTSGLFAWLGAFAGAMFRRLRRRRQNFRLFEEHRQNSSIEYLSKNILYVLPLLTYLANLSSFEQPNLRLALFVCHAFSFPFLNTAVGSDCQRRITERRFRAGIAVFVGLCMICCCIYTRLAEDNRGFLAFLSETLQYP